MNENPRRKVFYENRRLEIREILRKLWEWKGVEKVESEVCPDHIHKIVCVPTKMRVFGCIGCFILSFCKNSQLIGRSVHFLYVRYDLLPN